MSYMKMDVSNTTHWRVPTTASSFTSTLPFKIKAPKAETREEAKTCSQLFQETSNCIGIRGRRERHGENRLSLATGPCSSESRLIFMRRKLGYMKQETLWITDGYANPLPLNYHSHHINHHWMSVPVSISLDNIHTHTGCLSRSSSRISLLP